MFEAIFLIFLAVIWMIFASIQDLRTREIANWLNFSLIFFAIGFRFFYSLFSESWAFFYQGLIGLGIFLVLAHILYYGRFFAGGDAKLLIALGTILPFSTSFQINLRIFLFFFFLFFIVAAAYTIISSIYLSIRNFNRLKKEFKKSFKKNKNLVYIFGVFGLLFILGGLWELFLLFLGILILIIPLLYIYVKSIDESCMIRQLKTKELSEGDWLYRDVKIGKKLIKASWDGLSSEDIKLLKKNKKFVFVRQGLAFSPVFLISFLILVYFLLNKGFAFFEFLF